MKETKDIRISNEVVPANFLNIPADLKSKGIYFWFADQKGIDILLEPLDCKFFEKHYIIHEGQKLFLIYIGTAGTGKKKLSNLRKRLKWHLAQKHTNSEVNSGTLSTFRLALAILLGTKVRGDLARELVDNYIVKHLYLSWNAYENLEEIDSTEVQLIQTYRPLINLKSNPNKKINGTSTNEYRQLRAEHNKTLPKKKKESKKETKMNVITTQNDRGCIEIPFSDQDNLHHKIQNIEGLGGKITCTLYDSRDYNLSIYIQNNGNIWRSTGNIYNYFQNPDTTRGNTSRHILIQQEMTEKGIKNAILKVCPQDNSPQKPSSKNLKTQESVDSKPSNSFKTLSKIDFKSMEGKPKLLILPCTNAKLGGGEHLEMDEISNTFIGNLALLNFRQQRMEYLTNRMENRPEDFNKNRNGETVDVEYFQNSLENGPFLRAFERYSPGILYKNGVSDLIQSKILNRNLHVIFISAYYGIINFDDHIIDYHLMLTNGFNNRTRNILKEQISLYCQNNEIIPDNVFALLSQNYSSVLDETTANLWMIEHNGTADLHVNRPILTNFLNLV